MKGSPPLPPPSTAHSQTEVESFHLRISLAEQPLRRVRRSPTASKPELDDVAPAVPAVVKRIVEASMKPVEEVILILEEPAKITPERSRVPVALIRY